MIAQADVSTEALLRDYAAAPRPSLRDAIIERHQALVLSLAQKFARPGVPADDLAQTAWIALIGALDRYDPSHRTKFTTYAVHCMVGEIRRYFRDRTWAMKVPRTLQEIHTALPRRQEELVQRLGRSPSLAEMAEAFGVSDETLLEAMELGKAYHLRGLEDRQEMLDGNDSRTVADTVGRVDPAIEAVAEHAPLEAAVATLDERKQRIIRWRFFTGWSQNQVASELGVSQMQISRLERAALKELRAALKGT